MKLNVASMMLLALTLGGCGTQVWQNLNGPIGQAKWENAERHKTERFLVPVVQRDTRVTYNQLTGIQQHEIALRKRDFLECIYNSLDEAQKRLARRQPDRFTMPKTPAECEAIRNAPLGNSDEWLARAMAKVEVAESQKRAKLQASLLEIMDLDTGSPSGDTVIVSPTIKGLFTCNQSIGGGATC